IDAEADRLLLAVDAETGAVQIGKTAVVDPFLDAGVALIVDIDVTNNVREFVAVRIDAFVLGQESDARNAEAVHFTLLGRRDVPLEPGKTTLRSEPLAHFATIEVRQHARQELSCLVGIDDAAWLREQRWGLEVGCENFAVAVEDIGPRRRNRIGRSAAAYHVGIGRGRIEHEATRDNGIDKDESEKSEAETRVCLAGAIDATAVKQRLHYPASPALPWEARVGGTRGCDATPFHASHLRAPAAGGAGEAAAPVGSSPSNASSMVAIASCCGPAGMGGRSGRLFKCSIWAGSSILRARWRWTNA